MTSTAKARTRKAAALWVIGTVQLAWIGALTYGVFRLLVR